MESSSYSNLEKKTDGGVSNLADNTNSVNIKGAFLKFAKANPVFTLLASCFLILIVLSIIIKSFYEPERYTSSATTAAVEDSPEDKSKEISIGGHVVMVEYTDAGFCIANTEGILTREECEEIRKQVPGNISSVTIHNTSIPGRKIVMYNYDRNEGEDKIEYYSTIDEACKAYIAGVENLGWICSKIYVTPKYDSKIEELDVEYVIVDALSPEKMLNALQNDYPTNMSIRVAPKNKDRFTKKELRRLAKIFSHYEMINISRRDKTDDVGSIFDGYYHDFISDKSWKL